MNEKLLGWRKLSAWLLVVAMCGFVAVKIVMAGGTDIPPGVVELIEWVTAFFFLGNGVEHLAARFTITAKPKE